MDIFEAVKWAALRNVHFYRQGRDTSPEYKLRKIFRWYSTTFHTPLHEVDDLPLVDVLQAYWEQKLEDAEDIQDEIDAMLESPDDLKQRQIEEDMADADTWEIAQEELAAEAERAKEALKKKSETPIAPAVRHSKPGAEPVLAMQPTVAKAPEIKMTFLPEDEDLDLEKDGFGLLDKPA